MVHFLHEVAAVAETNGFHVVVAVFLETLKRERETERERERERGKGCRAQRDHWQ